MASTKGLEHLIERKQELLPEKGFVEVIRFWGTIIY